MTGGQPVQSFHGDGNSNHYTGLFLIILPVTWYLWSQQLTNIALNVYEAQGVYSRDHDPAKLHIISRFWTENSLLVNYFTSSQ